MFHEAEHVNIQGGDEKNQLPPWLQGVLTAPTPTEDYGSFSNSQSEGGAFSYDRSEIDSESSTFGDDPFEESGFIQVSIEWCELGKNIDCEDPWVEVIVSRQPLQVLKLFLEEAPPPEKPADSRAAKEPLSPPFNSPTAVPDDGIELGDLSRPIVDVRRWIKSKRVPFIEKRTQK